MAFPPVPDPATSQGSDIRRAAIEPRHAVREEARARLRSFMISLNYSISRAAFSARQSASKLQPLHAVRADLVLGIDNDNKVVAARGDIRRWPVHRLRRPERNVTDAHFLFRNVFANFLQLRSVIRIPRGVVRFHFRSRQSDMPRYRVTASLFRPSRCAALAISNRLFPAGRCKNNVGRLRMPKLPAFPVDPTLLILLNALWSDKGNEVASAARAKLHGWRRAPPRPSQIVKDRGCAQHRTSGKCR